MPTTTISQAGFIESAPAVVFISENSIPQNIPYGMEYAAFIGDTTQLYHQLDRNPKNQRWTCPDKDGQISTTDLLQHLQGNVTLGAYFHRNRQATLLVADDDCGGIDAAQAAVNHLLDHGLVAFALCYESLHFDGSSRHNGSHLFLKVSDSVLIRESQAALGAILAGIYSTSEIQGRCMLPFGVHKWAVNPYGTLVLPYAEPIALVDSGQHGLSLLAEQGILETENDVDHFLSFMPATAPVVAPVAAPVAIPSEKVIKGGHRDVVKAYNERYTAWDAIYECGFTKASRCNAKCICNKHGHGDLTPSIGVDEQKGLIYFNAPGCDFYNDKRPYTAFSLMQYVKHNGDYRAAIDEARAVLNMSFQAITPRIKPAIRQPQAAPVELHQNAIKAIAKDYKVYSEKLTAQQRQVLRIIFDKARNTGYAPIKWASLSKLAGVHENTCKYAVKKFVKDGMLVKFIDSTADNQSVPCVFQLLSPSLYDDQSLYPPVMAQASEIAHQNDMPEKTSCPPIPIKERNIVLDSIPAESESDTSDDSTSAAPVSLLNSPASDLPPASVAPAEAAIVEAQPTQNATENAPAALETPEWANLDPDTADLLSDGYNRAVLLLLQGKTKQPPAGASGITSPAYHTMAQAAPERPQAHQNRLTL